MMKNRKIKNNGFTLIELIVAIGLFGVAMVIGVGLLLSLIAAQKKAIAIRAVMDNIGFAFETMTKEIRTGYSYSTNVNYFSFSNGSNSHVEYYASNGQLMRCSKVGSNCSLDEFLPVTSPEVKVERLVFLLSGQASGDKKQPRVTVIMTVSSNDKYITSYTLETTVSQRQTDS
ncbi:MAG: type II secretion system protein [bacterium]|nr:type II secretion system protein [bacterium]